MKLETTLDIESVGRTRNTEGVDVIGDSHLINSEIFGPIFLANLKVQKQLLKSGSNKTRVTPASSDNFKLASINNDFQSPLLLISGISPKPHSNEESIGQGELVMRVLVKPLHHLLANELYRLSVVPLIGLSPSNILVRMADGVDLEPPLFHRRHRSLGGSRLHL